MKLPKASKKLVVVSACALVLAGSGAVFAFQGEEVEQKPIPRQETQEVVEAEPDGAEETEPVETVEEEEATEPEPVYGETSPGSGVYGVFDKYAVMEQAGIDKNSRRVAGNLIYRISGWVYKNPTPKFTLCGKVENQAGLKSVGSDYRTNPVTQLKWCNGYVESKYGSWENAASFYQAHKWF